MSKVKSEKIVYKTCDIYRLLDHLYAHHQTNHPVLGDNTNPNKDLVAIHSHVTFGHKASGVQNITKTPDGQFDILINHLNLAGMYGPLPDVYGEEIAQHNNKDMRDFLDIFHHRLMALMYRFYRKNRIFLGSKNVHENIVGKILNHLTGLSLFHKEFKFHKAGIYPFFNLFWRNNPSLSGIRQLIGGYFKIHTKTTPFMGGWVYPLSDELSYLGGPYNKLSQTLFLGRKSWDNTYGFILHFGPLDFKTYLTFVPPIHENFPVLKDLLRYYAGNHYHIKLALHLKSSEVPGLKLGKKSFLNYTTWLTPTTIHIKDTVVSVQIK